ncbi:MFS transporter [Streptomyces sp. INA 01156]
MPLALLALAVGAFGIGTTEFVIMGLLPDVADDLGISIPSAGHLVSAYALGVVVGAPLLAAATARISRRTVLIALMVLFVVGNALSAFAPTTPGCWPRVSSAVSRTAPSSAWGRWSPPTW